jgi:hypothetical protein
MRTRKAVITLALAGAALAATAASSSAFAATPFVGHDVGGGLVTQQPLTVGQRINLLGSGGRNTNYMVTAVSRTGDSYYDTVWPRIQTNTSKTNGDTPDVSTKNARVLFTTSFNG